jgi:predicted permease
MIDPGFQTKNIDSVNFDLAMVGYDPARSMSFQRQLVDRVATLPGVYAVAQATSIPLDGNHYMVEFSRPGDKEEYFPECDWVSPSFFTVTGIPILQGRNFTEAEYRSGAHLAVVSQFTAQHMWPGKNPMGQLIRGDDADWQVVGVARDAQVNHLGNSGELYLYLLAGKAEQPRLKLMVRSAKADPALGKEISAAVGDIDPNVPVFVTPMAANVDDWLAPSRVVSALAGTLGSLALLLASIGIYGMVSYGVSRRVREIGIRIALGAEKHDVAWLVIREGMVPVVAGALVAIVCGAFVSSFLSILLYGISPWDPAAFSGVAAVLVIVALLACYLPTRKAMRVDPMVALRYE